MQALWSSLILKAVWRPIVIKQTILEENENKKEQTGLCHLISNNENMHSHPDKRAQIFSPGNELLRRLQYIIYKANAAGQLGMLFFPLQLLPEYAYCSIMEQTLELEINS